MTLVDMFKIESTYGRWNSIPLEASWLRMFTKCLRNGKLLLGNSQDVCALCSRKIFLFSEFAVRLAFVVELLLHLHFLVDEDKSGASENESYQSDFNLSVNKTLFLNYYACFVEKLESSANICSKPSRCGAENIASTFHDSRSASNAHNARQNTLRSPFHMTANILQFYWLKVNTHETHKVS